MIFPKAKKIAKALDWYKTKDTVFGLYKGYFFNMGDSSLLSNPQSKYVIVTTDTLTEEQKLEINTALESNKKKLKFSNFEVDDQTVFVQFIEIYTYTKLKTVYALFDFLVDLLTKIGIPKKEVSKINNHPPMFQIVPNCATYISIDSKNRTLYLVSVGNIQNRKMH